MRFFFLLLFIASLAGLVLWGLPQWQEFQRLRVQQSILERIALNAREVIGVRDELLSRFNALLPEDTERLEALLPARSTPEATMALLQELALRHGLILKNLTIRNETIQQNVLVASAAKKSYNEVAIDMGLTGTYQSFQIFLASAEKNVRLLEIDSITFSAGEADSLEFHVQARARFLSSQ